MSLLSDDDLAMTRSIAAEAMPQTVTISRLVRSKDSAGGSTETWSAVATVTGRLVARGGSERVVGEGITAEHQELLKLPAGTLVTSADRVAVDGRTYQITEVDERGWQIEQVCILGRLV